MNKVERLAYLFGGKTMLARAINVDPGVISRWSSGRKRKAGRSPGGMVPPVYNTAILSAANTVQLPPGFATREAFMHEVASYLQQNVCPCCGGALEAGFRVDRRKLRKYLEG